MSRMTAHRTAMAAAAMAPLLLTVWAAGPAQAHGAPTYPVSRVYACSPQGGSAAGSTACKAAVAANGGPSPSGTTSGSPTSTAATGS